MWVGGRGDARYVELVASLFRGSILMSSTPQDNKELQLTLELSSCHDVSWDLNLNPAVLPRFLDVHFPPSLSGVIASYDGTSRATIPLSLVNSGVESVCQSQAERKT